MTGFPFLHNISWISYRTNFFGTILQLVVISRGTVEVISLQSLGKELIGVQFVIPHLKVANEPFHTILDVKTTLLSVLVLPQHQAPIKSDFSQFLTFFMQLFLIFVNGESIFIRKNGHANFFPQFDLILISIQKFVIQNSLLLKKNEILLISFDMIDKSRFIVVCTVIECIVKIDGELTQFFCVLRENSDVWKMSVVDRLNHEAMINCINERKVSGIVSLDYFFSPKDW